jgi:hypothetical protein
MHKSEASLRQEYIYGRSAKGSRTRANQQASYHFNPTGTDLNIQRLCDDPNQIIDLCQDRYTKVLLAV